MADSDEDWLYVLDHLPAWEDERDKPLVQGVGEDAFTLLAVTVHDDAAITIGERLSVREDESEKVDYVRHPLEYDELTTAAQADLEAVVGSIIEQNEKRFVDFFNTAEAATVRRHQLDLLPGIGDTLRNRILDERQRQPFTDFEELEARIDPLHAPADSLRDRILTELQDGDVRFYLFVDPP